MALMINTSYFSVAAAQIPQRGSKYLHVPPVLFQFTSSGLDMMNHRPDE